LFFMIGVVVSVFVGCAIHVAVERPVTRLLNARLRATSGKAALPVTAPVA
jgi:exopolysaccharide production protein ExoZ